MYRTLPLTTIDPQAFLGKAILGEDCWLWQGSQYANGYGKYGKAGIMAHRIAYQLFKGDIPLDMCLDHLCKQRNCINPDHLEIVTLVENVMRGESLHAINARKKLCKQGHQLIGDNVYRRPDRNTRECRICRAKANRLYMAKKEG